MMGFSYGSFFAEFFSLRNQRKNLENSLNLKGPHIRFFCLVFAGTRKLQESVFYDLFISVDDLEQTDHVIDSNYLFHRGKSELRENISSTISEYIELLKNKLR